jgi:hypothetical protein
MNGCKVLMGKPEEERPLGRPRLRRKDSIEMVRKEIGWGVIDWIHLAQDRDHWRSVVSMVMNHSTLKFLDIFEQLNNRWLLKMNSAPWR